MTYTPKEWNRGDTLAAEDLNHIEQGVANSGGCVPLIIRESGETFGCGSGDFALLMKINDRQFVDVWDAFHGVVPCLFYTTNEVDGTTYSNVGTITNSSQSNGVKMLSCGDSFSRPLAKYSDGRIADYCGNDSEQGGESGGDSGQPIG